MQIEVIVTFKDRTKTSIQMDTISRSVEGTAMMFRAELESMYDDWTFADFAFQSPFGGVYDVIILNNTEQTVFKMMRCEGVASAMVNIANRHGTVCEHWC